MSEQELYMMGEERAKDEIGAQNMMKKHQTLENSVEDFAEVIRQLGERSRELMEEEHPESDQIAVRQSQVDKLYAGLKDLAGERRSRLEEVFKLYTLHREIDDLLEWIADKSIVAGSNEPGQDYEHVCMLKDRFKEFAREIENIGQERVASANEVCDALITSEHSDAAAIAAWKDSVNDAWADLLELIDTRTELLQTSWELHKFFYDCKDTLERIVEKQNYIPEELGRDAQSVAALQRKHANFEHDLVALGTQVEAIQTESVRLQSGYAGGNAETIIERETEVLNAWKNLHILVEQRRLTLADASDYYRFMLMAKDLLLWIDDISRQMNTQERPRDVSGVELLMNNHQSLKAEIDAREENFAICINLGRDLLNRQHYRQEQVREKLIQLTLQRLDMTDLWKERWEHLQLILEVYQFARDAAVAEAWLIAQEPYLSNQDLGDTLDAVENLLKKHEAFEKSAATQEERFASLEKPTTFELKDREKRKAEEYGLSHPDELLKSKDERRHRYIREFLPLPVPKPEPVVEPVQPAQAVSVSHAAPDTREDTSGLTSSTEERVDVEQEERQRRQSAETGAGDTAHRRSHARIDGSSPDESERWQPTQSATPPKKSSRGKTSAPSEAVHEEGVLSRKHELEVGEKKAGNRSWDKLFVVLHGPSLSCYKDQKHAKTDPNNRVHHEPALDLTGATCQVAADYTKRPFVFELKLLNGSKYLFQAKDESEQEMWIGRINAATGGDGAAASQAYKVRSLPARIEKEEPKKRSFFTLKKK
uniref:PH domain-containing protein n=1 Tax=Arion vulgaris TaxID=1028688 RepID=A0A0B7BRC6_9EUPU